MVVHDNSSKDFWKAMPNKKDRWDISFVTSRFKVVISRRQIYIYHIDLLPLKISHLHFDLSRSLKVKFDSVIGLPRYSFLLMFHNKIGLTTRLLCKIQGFEVLVTLPLTFQASSSSKVMVSLDSSYMVSY